MIIDTRVLGRTATRSNPNESNSDGLLFRNAHPVIGNNLLKKELELIFNWVIVGDTYTVLEAGTPQGDQFSRIVGLVVSDAHGVKG
jgi:hypothetical protein